MTELVTSGSVGGMASNGCLYPVIEDSLGSEQFAVGLRQAR